MTVTLPYPPENLVYHDAVEIGGVDASQFSTGLVLFIGERDGAAIPVSERIALVTAISAGRFDWTNGTIAPPATGGRRKFSQLNLFTRTKGKL